MTFKNFDKFQSNIQKKLVKRPVENVQRAIARSTMLVRDTVVKSIQAGGTGETVLKYNPRRTHTQSAPKQPPASDTGFLVSQISTDVYQSGGIVVGKIISGAPYSKFLEFGTTTMTERPFMQPAIDRNKRKISRIFKDEGLMK